MLEFSKSILKSSFVAGCVGITFWDLFAYVSPVDGKSMQPLINPNDNEDNDLLLLWRIPIKFNRLNRGDVVTLISPKNPDQLLIKRVVGLPGDIIKTISYKKKYVRVPPGHCWIEGDNYDKSQDSNSYGAVPMGLLFAKAGYIIWPLERLSRINTEIPAKRLLHPLNITYNDEQEEEEEHQKKKEKVNDESTLETIILATNSKFNNFDTPIDKETILEKANNQPKLNYFIDYVSP